MTKNDNETVEQKIATLEQKVAWFDGDEFVLEQAMDRYEEAQKLADEIQADLSDLKNTIERVNLAEG